MSSRRVFLPPDAVGRIVSHGDRIDRLERRRPPETPGPSTGFYRVERTGMASGEGLAISVPRLGRCDVFEEWQVNSSSPVTFTLEYQAMRFVFTGEDVPTRTLWTASTGPRSDGDRNVLILGPGARYVLRGTGGTWDATVTLLATPMDLRVQ